MAEFKIGDRVRIVAFGGNEGRPVGLQGRVEKFQSPFLHVRTTDGEEWCCYPSELDHLVGAEQPLNNTNKFVTKDQATNKFVTKDSGARQDYPSGMVRDVVDGKPAFALLIPEGVPYADLLLTRWADLMARGAEKYEARNWEKASSQEELDRFKASAMRHFMQWFCGEQDEDHAAAVLFNVNAYETTKYKLENSQ